MWANRRQQRRSLSSFVRVKGDFLLEWHDN